MKEKRLTMKDRSRLKKTIEISEKFFQFEARNKKKINMNFPTRNTALVKLGECSQVNYVCDKFDGVVREYFHEFEDPCVLMVNPIKQPGGKTMLVILGKFKIGADGIVG